MALAPASVRLSFFSAREGGQTSRRKPLIKHLFPNGAQDFSMLGVYARAFGDCTHLARCLRRHGLEVETRHHFFGCAEGIAGRKPG